MKRRNFLVASSAGLAYGALPRLLQAAPCPPSPFSVIGGTTANSTCLVSSGGTLQITTNSILPSATQGLSYSQALAATGGTPPYAWKVISGMLNPFNPLLNQLGLSGNGAPGATPTGALNLNHQGLLRSIPIPNAQTDSVTIQVTDSAGASAIKSFQVTTNTQSAAFDLRYSVNPYGQAFADTLAPANPRYKLFLNAWGGAPDPLKDTQLSGFSERSWVAFQPYSYQPGRVAGYPLVGRGWYKNASFFAPSGTAPLQTTGIQISALSKAKIRWVVDTPIDRTSALSWGILDHYFHSIQIPNGSGDQHTNTDVNNPIFNLVILPYFLDTSGNFEFNFNHTGSSTNPNYGAVVELDGRMWMYWLFNSTAYAQNPPVAGAGGYNSMYITPLAGLNDCKQGGFKYFYCDYRKFLLDLCAKASGGLQVWNGSALVSASIPITPSSYMSNVAAGFEVNGGGPTTPTDSRYYYTKDFQVSLQNEADPVINVVPEAGDVFSKNLPVYTPGGTNYPASYAVSGNYGQWFRSNFLPGGGTDVIVAQDISSVSSTLLTSVLVTVLCGDTTNQFYTPNAQQSQPGSFVIECTTASFSSGVMPSSGWTIVGTVNNNVVGARAVYCGNWAAAGYKSWRVRCTGNSGNSQQTSSAWKMMASYAPITTGAPDGILFFGDSITKKSASYGYGEQGGASDYVGNGIYNYTGRTPACINAGISGWSLGSNNPADGSTFMPWLDGTYGTWLDDCPYRVLWLATGKNDSMLKGRNQSQYQTDNAWAVNRWLSTRSNGVVIIPSILNLVGDTANPTAATTFSNYNANLVNLAITGISKAASAVVTIGYASATNPIAVGQAVDFSNTTGGMIEIRGLRGTVTAIGGSSGAWTVTVNINSSNFSAFSSGGTMSRPNVISGPDINNISDAFKSIMFDANDVIHPGVFGQPIYKSLYLIDWIARCYYLGQPASTWRPDFSAGTGVGGR